METILNLLPLSSAQQDAFRAAAPGAEHIFVPAASLRFSSEDATAEQLAAATVILGCPSGAALSRAGNLKWLHTWSAGVDPYLRPGVLPAGAALTCSAGAYGPAVSEHMLAMLLALMKRLPQYRDWQNERIFTDLGAVKSLAGATVLVGGCGDIGSHFALLCKALGAGRVVGLRRDPAKPAAGFDEVRPLSDLDALLPLADVVALALPSTPDTDGLLDERRLGLMKPDAILLNAGRGAAVDCAALARCMAAGRLWGAGLDVTCPEPLPEGHPLWLQPLALITPHVAGGGHLAATVERIVDIALDNLGRYCAGRPLRNRMN